MRRNKKGNVSKVKSVNLKDKMIFAFSFFVFLCAIGLTVGFSAFYKNMSIDMSAIVRVDKDVRISSVGNVRTIGGTVNLSTDYNHNNVHGAAVFMERQPEYDGDDIEYVELVDGISYEIVIKNLGNEEMGIASVTPSNTNLVYNFYDVTDGNYNVVGDKICTSSSKCTLGAFKMYALTIYLDEDGSGYTGAPSEYTLEFDFQPYQSVSCESGVCSSSYSTEVMKTKTYTATLNVSNANYLKVTMGGVTLKQGTGYTYNTSTKKLSIPNVTGDIYISEEEPVVFSDGEAVYFDVKAGTKCSASDYVSDNSVTGYNGITKTITAQTSCLKFYAFNDTESATKVNLLLDHNIRFNSGFSHNYAWNEDGYTYSGPYDCFTPYCALGALYFSTSSWNGTEALDDYSYSAFDSEYRIFYGEDGYAARFITANEVADIAGEPNFGETYSTDGFNFSGDLGWLTDRTSPECFFLGYEGLVKCNNNNDLTDYTSYYWTGSASEAGSNYAWVVDEYGLWEYDVADDYDSYGIGVRPVIEVSKAKFN